MFLFNFKMNIIKITIYKQRKLLLLIAVKAIKRQKDKIYEKIFQRTKYEQVKVFATVTETNDHLLLSVAGPDGNGLGYH